MEPRFKLLGHVPDDCQDPFWYEGPSAQLDAAGHHYEVLACGEIRIRDAKSGDLVRWHDVARQAVNDAGLESLVGNEGSARPYWYENNSWFEVTREDQGSGGDAYFNFKEAVAEMWRMARQDDHFTCPDR